MVYGGDLLMWLLRWAWMQFDFSFMKMKWVWISIAGLICLNGLTTPQIIVKSPFFMRSNLSVQVDSVQRVDVFIPPLVSPEWLIWCKGQGLTGVELDNGVRIGANRFQNGQINSTITCARIHGFRQIIINSGARSATFQVSTYSALNSHLLLLIVAFLFVIGMLRKRITNTSLFWLVFGTIAIRMLYCYGVPWNIYSPDVSGHIQYVSLFYRYGHPPAASAGWQCYQPPFYYSLLYLLRLACEHLGLVFVDIARVFSFVVSTGYLLFGCAILWKSPLTPRVKMLVVGIFAFWPESILVSPVINNDLLVNLFGVTAIWFLYPVLQARLTPKSAGIALGFGSLALLSKTSGALYLLLVVLGIGVAWLRHWSGRRIKISTALVMLGLLTLTGLAAQLANFSRSKSAEARGDALVGNIDRQRSDPSVIEYENSLSDFLPTPNQIFNLLTKPNPSADDTVFGAGYWTNFLHSNIVDYSDASIKMPGGRAAVVLMTANFLILIMVAGWSLRRARRSDFAWWLWLLMFLLASLYFRWRYPFACSANSRYILGATIPFAYLVGVGIERVRTRLGKVILFANAKVFTVCSGLFYALLALSWRFDLFGLF